MGGWHLGLRISRADVAAILEPDLRPVLVDDRVQANWSLRVGGFAGAERSGEARLHLLYRACQQVARSQRPSDVVRSFAHQLEPFGGSELSGWGCDLTVLVDQIGRAVLAPPSWRRPLMRHGRRLAVAGIRVADAPRVAIDLGDGAVRVPAPVLSFHRDALDALDATLGAATGSVHVAAGRYPINAWAVPLDPMSDSPARRLAAVVGLLERIPDVDRAQESLELLRDHLAETLAVPVVPDGPVALLAAVLELFDGR